MKRKFTIVDILLGVITVFMAVVSSPFVIRQFSNLTKPGDVIWNISLDIVVGTLFILVVYIVDRLLNRFL